MCSSHKIANANAQAVMGKTFIGNNLTQGPPTISTNMVACKVYTFNGLESAEPSIIPQDKNTELKQKP